ncbi:MAG: phosphatase PAP2 family protein [Flavobacteriales bacterium]|nr:phosphatase PAP2 family protein [Flavobacteriales bacterium]
MSSHTIIVRRFLVTWSLFAIVGAVVAITGDKFRIHAAMNQYHPWWLDGSFKILTVLADGWVPTILALGLLLVKEMRAFLMMGVSCSLGAIIVQVLKHGVFPDMDRPSAYQQQLGTMEWVSGVDMHQHFSFPSGHSAAAFGMCMALAVIINKRQWAVPLALLATGMAYSRIHLSQHFLQDTVAGSTIGVATAVLVYFVLYRSSFAKRPWLDRRLFRQNQNRPPIAASRSK